MIKTRFDKEYQSMKIKERKEFLKKNFNSNQKGKYIVETKSSICNGWSWLMPRFESIKDAKRFIKFYCVPNKFGLVEKGRVIHLEYVDEITVKEIVDWEQK